MHLIPFALALHHFHLPTPSAAVEAGLQCDTLKSPSQPASVDLESESFSSDSVWVLCFVAVVLVRFGAILRCHMIRTQTRLDVH